MSGKVILLTSDQPWARALARAARALAHGMVESGIFLKGIIVETAPQPKCWKQVLHDFLGEDLYLSLVSRRWPAETRQLLLAERKLQRNAEQQLADCLGGHSHRFPKTQTLFTDDLNSDRAYQFLESEAPDLVVTFATGLLRKRTFETGRLGAINAHTSVLPDYRGAWPEFWQIYDQAYAKTGITIHFIDEGVDTGDIVHRHHVPVSEDTDPFVLRTLNTMQIVRDYPRVIQKVLSGTNSRSPQPASTTPTYRHRDVTEEKKRELFQRLNVLC
jgi:folate-dependent phosphoribosylglycinamide formyltransferase PurN